jgi:hypothetical protein
LYFDGNNGFIVQVGYIKDITFVNTVDWFQSPDICTGQASARDE